jgi:uncharacterized protein (DUF486 family)
MKKSSFSWKLFIFWLFLNVMVAITMDLAFFVNNMDFMKNSGFIKKLAMSEFWATIEWMFLIPANRMGNKILTAAQVNLSSFVFDFLGQIATNKFLLDLPTTVDDYTAMGLILLGMYFSIYKTFG